MKKGMLQILILSIIIGTMSLIYMDAFHLTKGMIRRVYPEHVVTISDFNTGRAILKDLELLPDDSLKSTSADPWIVIAINGTDKHFRLHSLSIEASDVGEAGLSTTVFYADSYRSVSLNLKDGMNRIGLFPFAENDYALRIDLTDRADQVFKVSTIIVNETQEIFLSVRRIIKITALYMLFAFFIHAMRCYIQSPLFPWRDFLGGRSGSAVRAGCFVLMATGLVLGVALPSAGALAVFLLMKQTDNDAGRLPKLSRAKSFMTNVAAVCIIAFAMRELPFRSHIFTSDVGIKCCFALLFYLAWLIYNKDEQTIAGMWLYLIVHISIEIMLSGHHKAYYLIHELNSSVLAVNLLLTGFLIRLLRDLLGKHLGGLLWYVPFMLLSVANFIKIRFQNATITIDDLSLYREIARMAEQFVGKKLYIILTVMSMLLIYCFIRFGRKITRYLKPEFSRRAIGAAALPVALCILLAGNTFAAFGMDLKKEYPTSREQVRALGIGTCMMLELSGREAIGEPEGYSVEIIEAVNAHKNEISLSEIHPNIILILAESLFDAENIPGVSFNCALTANLKAMNISNVISPSYGGRTASAEFEALTGLSNFFMPGESVPYATYLKYAGSTTGSLAREFKDNGYTSIAIHANRETFYNRNIIYDNMGFDDFISKEDMNPAKENYLKDGTIEDSYFVDEIINALQASAGIPMFIFGASLEGHALYKNKYETVLIRAESDRYEDSALEELSVYGQTLYQFDAAMGKLVNYIEESGEPTIIYIFGDHLPALLINADAGYTEDPLKMYSTPLYAWSNYKTLSDFPDGLSLNQLPVEILRESGIAYRAYYDVIYDLRKSYPLLHKSFTVDKTGEMLALYREIQWDLLNGQRFLLND